MWRYLRTRAIHKILLLLLVDIVLLTACLYGGYVLKFSWKAHRLAWAAALHRANLFLFVAVLSHLLFLYLYGLYAVVRPFTPMRVFLLTFYALGTSTAILMLLQFFVPGYWMGRVVLTLQFPLCVFTVYLWRILYYRSPLSIMQRRNLALVGPGPLIEGFLREAQEEIQRHYHVVGVYCSDHSTKHMSLTVDVERYPSLASLLEDARVEALAFQAADGAIRDEEARALLRRNCEGLEVSDLITLYKNMTGKVPLRYCDDRWLLSYAGIHGGPSPFYLKIKRVIDVSVAGTALILSLPLMILVALLIRLSSSGPILFKQERLGKNRRPFPCLKFRTMVEEAEKETGPVWSSPHDPRVTPLGRWLRSTRIDELPQLINILRGDMSLIGPRPIRAHFADQLSQRIPLYELRFALRPGLTGWAQVNFPYADTEESQLEKFEYELFYIQNASLFLDCMILLRTLRTIFHRKGR
jgi:exopolysaccharide biosynthesis polyprenyl glycosylphosphotransferase